MQKTIFKLLLCFFLVMTTSVQAMPIGLKISAEKNWYAWGDYILGQDLEQGFSELGHSVYPAYMDNFYPKTDVDTKIDVYMHGFVPFNPPKDKNKFKVLYLYYPLETANMEKYQNIDGAVEPDWYSLQTELWDYDLIAVASPLYQEKLKLYGIPTIFTPQFTNPKKFYYEYDASKAFDILFVGRPGYERISAKWAIESGFDVALFGSGWENKAPKKYFKGAYIDNEELHKYYASAKIVLNDTREDMKKDGFISNRIFDVTASGGFVISDYMPEIEQFYGDSIPMFRDKNELKELIEYYLAHPDERKKKAKQAQEITLKYFTNIKIAGKIIEAYEKLFLNNIEANDDNDLVLKFPWPETAKEIGDYWLGKDLEAGLKEAGFNVKSYYHLNEFKTDDFYKQAKNLLYMQFKYNFTDFEDEDKARIMYLYFPTFIPERGKFVNTKDTFKYNTDAYLNNELEYFDIIATPAKNIFNQLQERHYETAFVPQFTNPQKFYPAPDEKFKTDLLFVGSRWYERISVKYAIELGYDISVYGMNWKDKIPQRYIKGEFIDNRELYKYYSSAKIVLNDQAQDLSEMGIVINRIYDATAAGALVISHYSPYIEEIFGDTIPMFKNKEEFKTVVDYYLSHPEERAKKAEMARQITLDKHTNTLLGKTFRELFLSIRKAKK